MLGNPHSGAFGMNLVAGHVVIIAIVAVCATILGMAHILHGSDPTNIYIACIASFSAHGVTSTLKGSPSTAAQGGGESG